VKRQNLPLLGPSAPNQDLHFGIALAYVDRADDAGDHLTLEATYPHVNAIAIPRPEALQIAVVERVDQSRNTRMPAPLWPVYHDRSSRDE
jgi:hypothetical protein